MIHSDGMPSGMQFVVALGCGRMAGVCFAFSTFVVQALARLPAEHGIAAMQSTYVLAVKSWFLVACWAGERKQSALSPAMDRREVSANPAVSEAQDDGRLVFMTDTTFVPLTREVVRPAIFSPNKLSRCISGRNWNACDGKLRPRCRVDQFYTGWNVAEKIS